MRITRYQDLIAWQLARTLERHVFAFTGKPAVARDVDFCRQIRRSSSSAPRNMTEGFGRFWPAEFAHKLRIAIGELEETQDHLEKAFEMHYITDAEHLEHIAELLTLNRRDRRDRRENDSLGVLRVLRG